MRILTADAFDGGETVDGWMGLTCESDADCCTRIFKFEIMWMTDGREPGKRGHERSGVVNGDQLTERYSGSSFGYRMRIFGTVDREGTRQQVILDKLYTLLLSCAHCIL